VSGYLIDTNVISAGAVGRTHHASAVHRWMDANTSSLHLSVVTIAEIEAGIAKSLREAAQKKASRLTDWLETVLHLYADRVLPIDIAVARIAGGLSDLARSRGQTPGFADIAIAATARAHGMTILTRNLRHFAALDVTARDPFVDMFA
jgi:predicted nucleic acid-binding protein